MLLLSPEKIKRKIMTFLRKKQLQEPDLSFWTPPGHMPDSRSGTGKELSESWTSNCARQQEIAQRLMDK